MSDVSHALDRLDTGLRCALISLRHFGHRDRFLAAATEEIEIAAAALTEAGAR